MSQERIHWSNLSSRGNRFQINPCPEMLLPDGHVVIRKVSQSVGQKPQPVEVVYDESYIVSWLENAFVRHMRNMPFNDMSKLLGKAYKAYKAGV